MELKTGDMVSCIIDNTIIPNDISAIDNNTTLITFGSVQAGVAVCMFGNMMGTPRMNPSFVYTQTSPDTTWVINHDLGYYPIVRIFSGNSEILPTSIVHNSIWTVTVTFDTALTGIARLI